MTHQPFQVTSTPLSVKYFTSHKVPFLISGCFGVFWGTQAIPVTVPGMMFYHCVKESMFPNCSKRWYGSCHKLSIPHHTYAKRAISLNTTSSFQLQSDCQHTVTHPICISILQVLPMWTTTLAEDHVSTVTITTAWTSNTGRRGAGFDIDSQTKSHSSVHHFLSSGKWFQSVSTPMLHHFVGQFGHWPIKQLAKNRIPSRSDPFVCDVLDMCVDLIGVTDLGWFQRCNGWPRHHHPWPRWDGKWSSVTTGTDILVSSARQYV